MDSLQTKSSFTGPKTEATETGGVRIPLSRPDITDREIRAVCAVLESPDLALGPTLQRFETEFARALGRNHAVAVNSGTSALFLSLSALDIGPGDEVITTPFTFIASTTSILMTGAKPVFVDIDPVSLNMDPGRIETAITAKTRAILPVEVFGNPLHMDAIRGVAQERRLPIVEDSCEALGSALNGTKAGCFGTLSAFAFYPNKQITTGEGGLLLTDDDGLAERVRSLRNQGRSTSSRWLQHERLGYNYRMSDINAALGRVQLSRLDDIVAKRARVARWYRERLQHETRIVLPRIEAGVDMSWFVFVVRLVEAYTQLQRDLVMRELTHRGIQTSNYFPPVHLQPFIVDRIGHAPGDFPLAEGVAQRTLALPFHNHLSEEQVDIVCNELSRALDGVA
jgi:perosamine synthetase